MNEIRQYICDRYEEVEEGLIRGAMSVAATPFKLGATAVKTVPRAVGGAVGAAGRTVKAAGQLATLKPKKALGTLGRAGKSLAKPVTGAAKDVGKMVTKPVKQLRKGGVVY